LALIGFVFSTNRVAASKPKALGMAEWKLQFGFVFSKNMKIPRRDTNK